MSFKQINCPSCGAPLELQYRFSKMVVCSYCGQSIHLTSDADYEAKGNSTPLTDYGSKFSVGQRVTIQNNEFTILGRIRFSYPSGFWDEWFMVNKKDSDSEYWLQEDEGDYILFGKANVTDFPDFATTHIGTHQDYFGDKIFISEKNTAEVTGGEGELPFQVIPGEQANFIDGIIVKKATPVSYEYLPKETLLYIGTEIQLDDITIGK